MHPHDETLFVSGDYQGSIMFWHVNSEEPIAVRASGEQGAHEACIWSLAWHPLGTLNFTRFTCFTGTKVQILTLRYARASGHILCSGSNDHSCKFWCRNRYEC